jgi:hypothetical protein
MVRLAASRIVNSRVVPLRCHSLQLLAPGAWNLMSIPGLRAAQDSAKEKEPIARVQSALLPLCFLVHILILVLIAIVVGTGFWRANRARSSPEGRTERGTAGLLAATVCKLAGTHSRGSRRRDSEGFQMRSQVLVPQSRDQDFGDQFDSDIEVSFKEVQGNQFEDVLRGSFPDLRQNQVLLFASDQSSIMVSIDVKTTGDKVNVASPRGICIGDESDLPFGVHGLDVSHFQQPEYAPQSIPKNLVLCHARELLFCLIHGEEICRDASTQPQIKLPGVFAT